MLDDALAALRQIFTPPFRAVLIKTLGLTLLVVEQNETIQVQRGLLRQLFGDSIELSAMRVRINRQKNDAQSHSQSPASPVTPASRRWRAVVLFTIKPK